MNSVTLFSPLKVGRLQLPNRIVMAPMTRCRAVDGNVPNPLAVTYYGQRASAGLIVTEATQVMPEGAGYPNTPGIYSEAQIKGWGAVTGAVHHAGGRIYLQLWHVGRISHPHFQPNGQKPVAPSAIKPTGQSNTLQGPKPFETPRALELAEIGAIVKQYAQGAKNALDAGFDGVEIHGANGYLIDQFLEDGTNHRSDAYGGSIENRARFLLEITKAVVDVCQPDRVGVRLSPGGVFNDMHDSNPNDTFGYAATALDRFGLAYLHLKETVAADVQHGAVRVPTSSLRERFRGPLMVNSGYTLERAQNVVESKQADLIAFGATFLANPDLPKRLESGAPLNPPNQKTFYGGGAEGYTDYPALTAAKS